MADDADRLVRATDSLHQGDGVLVVLDPGAVFAELEPSLRSRVIALTDVWTGNAEESEDFGGAKGMGPAAEAVSALLEPGAVAVVRDGEQGCAVHADGVTSVVPGYPETPVDTNGAGDTHTGVLLAEVARRGAVERAVLVRFGLTVPEALPSGVEALGAWLVHAPTHQAWVTAATAADNTRARTRGIRVVPPEFVDPEPVELGSVDEHIRHGFASFGPNGVIRSGIPSSSPHHASRGRGADAAFRAA